MENSKKEIPKEGPGDYAHAIVKGALGAIPIAGSIASETFGLIVTPPLKKRMDQWLNTLHYEIEKLKEKSDVYKLENLQNNDQFISTITAATQIAIKTHSEEKLAALKNATMNSITQSDENLEQPLFLNLIDTLTPLHIRVLKHFYRAKGGYMAKSIYEFAKIYTNLLPAHGPTYLDVKPTLIPTILIDLENRGLVERRYSPAGTSPDHRLPPEPSGFTIETSDFGNRFYDFISKD